MLAPNVSLSLFKRLYSTFWTRLEGFVVCLQSSSVDVPPCIIKRVGVGDGRIAHKCGGEPAVSVPDVHSHQDSGNHESRTEEQPHDHPAQGFPFCEKKLCKPCQPSRNGKRNCEDLN